MALEASFRELHAQLQHLHETLRDLRTTVVEDKPLRDDVVLVDLFGNAVDDLLGWLEGALNATLEAQQAVAHPVDLNRAWRALSLCQQYFHQINQRFIGDLLHYERRAELMRFGRQRGGEWQAWAKSVKVALERCQPPLFAVGQALFDCWQEVAERIGMNIVSVQTTNVGPLGAAPEKIRIA